ncbi:MAG: divergent polysaccharide deacetylase family protein [Sphingomonadales bacterium]|jgi:polysaccharide deacetylase 2 family uncharacterized protein YibQ
MARQKPTRLKSKSRHGKRRVKLTKSKKQKQNKSLLVRAISFGMIFGLGLVALLFFLPKPPSQQEQALQLKAAQTAPKSEIKRPSVAFSRPKPKEQIIPSEPAKEASISVKPATETRAKIAIVIDDVGHDWDSLKQAANLPSAVTLAFLPYVDDVQRKADFARSKGHELLVHLPMEPKSNGVDPGPMFLKVDSSRLDLAQRIQWNLDRFNGYVGINNHMGSLFTEDRGAMHELFVRLKERGVLFLDSRTTAHSAGALLANEMKLSYAERDVFLDNAIEANAVEQQLETAEAKALQNGNAIAIGHPHFITLDELEAWTKEAKARGFELVPISEIIKERGTPLWRSQLDHGISPAGFGGK